MVWTPEADGFENETPRSTSAIAWPELSTRNQYVTDFVFATEGTPLAKTGRFPGAVSPFTFITSTWSAAADRPGPSGDRRGDCSRSKSCDCEPREDRTFHASLLGSLDPADSPLLPLRFTATVARTGGPTRAKQGDGGSLPTVLAFADSRPSWSMRRQLAHLSDEALVALVARADENALAELYDRVGRIAYGLALRVLRDERLAEDAVQEGFLAVWRTAAAFRAERAKASTWILTLVHRRAVDLVRREERRRTEPLPDEAGSTSGHAMDDATDEVAWLRFERERVQAALLRLPDVQREAIELAYYGGFSQSELAERLGVPLGTIKSRMFAGLARLRELLDESAQEGSWRPEFTS
jgi:RNA polymerase sigma-70 factor (ECF subfamily)